MHHVDDFRVYVENVHIGHSMSGMKQHFTLKVGELERPGVAVSFLGRKKVRTHDAIITVPDPKHAEKIIAWLGLSGGRSSPVPGKKLVLTEESIVPLEGDELALYRTFAGSAIYLALARADLKYAAKELARRVSKPRKCDMVYLIVVGQYPLGTKDYASRTLLESGGKSDVMSIDGLSDSDWQGCAETGKSTSGNVLMLDSMVIDSSSQTQPGLPALSSGESEFRSSGKCALDLVFVKYICDELKMKTSVPRLWADSSAGRAAANRLGPGRMRHLDTSALYIQELVKRKQLIEQDARRQEW